MNIWKLAVGFLTAVVALSTSGCERFEKVTPENARGVIHVYTVSRCSACQMAKPIVQRLKNEGYKIRVIDCNKYPKKAGKVDVHMVPTFIHYRDGEQTRRIVGTASYAELVGMYR